MRNAYVKMIGGTLLIAAVLGGVGTMLAPSGPVSPVSVKDAATAASGSASQQAAALEAAELEARENPPPPSSRGVVQSTPEPSQVSVAASGYQGSAPTPSIQFGESEADASEDAPVVQLATDEE